MTSPRSDFADLPAKEYLAAARDGSCTALGHVLDAYREYLLAIAQRELPDDIRAKAGASDLVQDTFVEAHRGFPGFRGESEAELLAWLRQILLHNLNDFVRHYRECAKRQVSRETPLKFANGSPHQMLRTPAASPSGAVIRDEQATLVNRAIDQLMPDYQRVLRLRYWDARSFEEIGELMNRSPEAARKLWFRAVQALERELERKNDVECFGL